MAAASPLQALRVPGALAAEIGGQIFDFSTVFPHGGTALGLVRDVVWRRTEGRVLITAEEFGVEVVDAIYGGEVHVLALALRGWDDDGANLVFPNTELGTTSGRRGAIYPGPRAPGASRVADAVRLIFTPDDTANHQAVYFRAAIPLLAETLEVPLGRKGDQEVLLKCVFQATRRNFGDGSAVQVELLEDLTV